MTDLEILAKNLKRYRQLKGLKQTELAERIGMSPDHLSKIEATTTGNVGLRFLTKIRRELDVELCELFMEDGSEVSIKFIVGEQNLESLERVLDKISERVDIRFKVGPEKPIFYHPQDCGCAYCKLKRRREKK